MNLLVRHTFPLVVTSRTCGAEWLGPWGAEAPVRTLREVHGGRHDTFA